MSYAAQIHHGYSMAAGKCFRPGGGLTGREGAGAERRVRWPFSLSVPFPPSLAIRGGNMITTGPKVIVAGAATLALGAGTGIATAAMMTSPSPVDSPGVIHGCWTNRAINGSH